MRLDIKKEPFTLLSVLVYTVCLFVSNIFILTVGLAVNANLFFFIISLILGSLAVWGMHCFYVKNGERVYLGASAFCNILLIPVLLTFMNFLIIPLSELFGVYDQFDLGMFFVTVIVYVALLIEMVVSMIILLKKNYKSR